MLFRFEAFPGFSDEDFAAFEERKWSSNRFNLERMKVRAKMEALGRNLETSLGPACEGLHLALTLDHPHIFNRNSVRWMWAYLDRPEEERNTLAKVVDKDLSLKIKVEDSVPQQQAAVVGVGIDAAGVSVFLRLHHNALLDRRNLAARLADRTEHQHLAVLFERLPEDVSLTFGDEQAPLPTTSALVADFKGRLEQFTGWMVVQSFFSADDAIVGSPDLTGAAAGVIPQLLDVWRFGAWSRDNDQLKLGKVLKEEKKQKLKRLTGFQPGDDVTVIGGLLAGKRGTVMSVDLKGRVKAQFGRVAIDMDSKLLKKS